MESRLLFHLDNLFGKMSPRGSVYIYIYTRLYIYICIYDRYFGSRFVVFSICFRYNEPTLNHLFVITGPTPPHPSPPHPLTAPTHPFPPPPYTTPRSIFSTGVRNLLGNRYLGTPGFHTTKVGSLSPTSNRQISPSTLGVAALASTRALHGFGIVGAALIFQDLVR